MTATWWWSVRAAGVVCHVIGVAVPAFRCRPRRRLTFTAALEAGSPRWAALSVVGLLLLLVGAGMRTEGVGARAAVVGAPVIAGMLAAALAVRRHDARLDRAGGADTDR